MTRRINGSQVAPGAYRAMAGLQQYVQECGIEHSLLELVKLRASQINGCAYCLDMHAKDARAAGERQQRIDVLSAWREAPFYSPRERAGLAWAEAITCIQDGVSDALFAEVRAHFSEKELVDLTAAIIVINGWNRLSVGLGADVGSYQPPKVGASV